VTGLGPCIQWDGMWRGSCVLARQAAAACRLQVAGCRWRSWGQGAPLTGGQEGEGRGRGWGRDARHTGCAGRGLRGGGRRAAAPARRGGSCHGGRRAAHQCCGNGRCGCLRRWR
jgi:hypothetical protein